jgi:hypothetical protein
VRLFTSESSCSHRLPLYRPLLIYKASGSVESFVLCIAFRNELAGDTLCRLLKESFELLNPQRSFKLVQTAIADELLADSHTCNALSFLFVPVIALLTTKYAWLGHTHFSRLHSSINSVYLPCSSSSPPWMSIR